MDETEAYSVLLSRAERKTGTIPSQILVRHILSITRGGGWPVQREAMEALLRRHAFGRRDDLKITARPPRGAIYGLYRTSRGRSSDRPYRTLFESLDPLRGSCDCPDFVRSSLGCCKHLLAVVEAWTGKPRKLKDALRIQGLCGPGEGPRLQWDSVRPLLGSGDWLERVRWTGVDAGKGSDGARSVPGWKWFRRGDGADLEIVDAHAARPARRLEMVKDLAAVLERTGRARGWTRLPPDPALAALLRLEVERLESVLGDSISPRAAAEAMRSLKLELYTYQ
ncbi:MAG TPA: SWIM zinc finger family protein, partial [Planctomycetota bacterium]|nr:SWIM zinc finger family protein [Planctomycetota bacterium]